MRSTLVLGWLLLEVLAATAGAQQATMNLSAVQRGRAR